ncbi:hypothetical protein [Cytophaga hutchinsonii]|jgi:hypothetical protein|uniref:HTH cro/C1-type domain-containing protein n=1 Tax=Cytophaga hutchinsonii (strain ATCC 33406 / DSM 1761 / CIP 103989 / NBRC 15051 / NCIMB 9469 / D465) TaxID=269798 RepID=A0A6N4SN26_CYTH3|nr:hypothetical protein [Cytophaga hutchinsonii]ABG57679.1 conserved hypothetical protein [Cytophaga hutchinsonii ATCC 33406]SFX02732.1 hypothetical protein SAMN04487930_101239 [Cytophaga hutchinsonii ATCC 33406]
MKKDEIPQDPSVLDKFTKEVCYAVDESGKYTTHLSRGWEVKADALGVTWEDIERKVAAAKKEVLDGKLSPIAYYVELRVMDLSIVSAYTGFWQWTIKRHLKPSVFKNLSDSKLQKYADLFEVTIDQLKNISVHA